MTRQYSTIELNISALDTDVMTAILFQEGSTGIEEKSSETWEVYFEGIIPHHKLEDIFLKIKRFDPSFQPSYMKLTIKEERDWLSEWKKSFVPLRVDKSIWVFPPWEQPSLKTGEIALIIDPRMAFGTGHHATTQLMIRAINRYMRPGSRVLDAGCGSGILSILAAKLGASLVCGFDVEKEATENSKHNASLNGCKHICFIQGDLNAIRQNTYDLILANINRSVLETLLPDLNHYLEVNGMLILSGILVEEKGRILDILPEGLQMVEEQKLQEWISLVLTK